MQMTDKGYCICGGALQLWQTKNVKRKQLQQHRKWSKKKEE